MSHLFAVDDRVVSERCSDLSNAVPCSTVSQNVTSQTSRDESSIAEKGVYIPGRDIVRFCWRGYSSRMADVFRQFKTLGVASDKNAVF